MSTGADSNDVAELRTRLLEMGGIAEEMLANAASALKRRDLPLAADTVDRDAQLDGRAVFIDDLSLRVLALRQPLARDLRETVAALKIGVALERVGDLAKSIARRVAALATRGTMPAENGVHHMAQVAKTQLADSLNAYAAGDIDAAVALWRGDVKLDDLNEALFRDLVAQMSNTPALAAQGAHLLFIAKNLERIGDHTTLIAEMTHYVVVGESLGMRRPKGRRSTVEAVAGDPG